MKLRLTPGYIYISCEAVKLVKCTSNNAVFKIKISTISVLNAFVSCVETRLCSLQDGELGAYVQTWIIYQRLEHT